MKSLHLSSIAKEIVTVGEDVNGVWNFVGYIRVSTKAQAEVQHGSPEQQRHTIVRWARRFAEDAGREIRLHLISEEISGAEGATLKRIGYQTLLHAVDRRFVDGVVTEKLDRLGRDQNEMYSLAKLAQERGVGLYETESGAVNLRDRSSRMSFKIKSMFAEETSLDLKEKIPKKQREARVNNGKDTSTVAVLGLDAHPTKTGMYLNNVEEGRQVLGIAQRCLELGGVCHDLENYCREKGYVTKVRFTREKIDKEGNRQPPRKVGGEAFDIKRLQYLLKNPKLRGTGRFEDSWNQFPKLQDAKGFVDFKYNHQPVIPPDLFDAVQAVLAERAAKHGRSGENRAVYLLSGIFITSDGRRFQGATHNGGRNAYYTTADRKILIPKDKLEGMVLQRVRDYIEKSGTLSDVLQTALKHRLTGLPIIEDEIRSAKAKHDKLRKDLDGFTTALREAVTQNPANVIEITQILLTEKKRIEGDLEQSVAAVRQLEDRRAQITEKFQEKTLQEYVRLAMKRFNDETDAVKKQIVQTIIPKIVYHPEEKRLELFVNPENGVDRLPSSRHTGGENLRVSEKWRGGRDSNPRPPP